MAAGDGRRWIPLLATVVAVALGIALGAWQVSRAHEKRELQRHYEALARDGVIAVSSAELRAGDVELRRVNARGAFVPQYGVLVDNRVMHGVPGYHVVMPLDLGNGRYVLVNRGWIAGSPDRSQLPQVRTPDGPVRVSGVAIVPGKQLFELSSQVIEGRVWQNLTIERYRKAYPLAIQPFVIRQDSALDDGLAREWEPPEFGIERHYAYAAQWFALAATAFVFYVVTHVRRRRKGEKEKQA